MAAAPSTVPADREAAFVRSTGNGIVWHRLECDIIVLGVFFLLIESSAEWGTLEGN